jgi:hypothetical protein
MVVGYVTWPDMCCCCCCCCCCCWMSGCSRSALMLHFGSELSWLLRRPLCCTVLLAVHAA